MKLSKSDLKRLILEEMGSVVKTMTEVDELSDEEIEAELSGAPVDTTPGTAEAAPEAAPEDEQALKMKAATVRQELMGLVPTLVHGSISDEERAFIFQLVKRLAAAGMGGDFKSLISKIDRQIGMTGVDRLAKKV